MAETDKAAIGFSQCGCPTFAMVLGYSSRRDTEREIAKVLRSGRRVELMTVGEARKLPNFLDCKHHIEPPENPKEEAARLLDDPALDEIGKLRR